MLLRQQLVFLDSSLLFQRYLQIETGENDASSCFLYIKPSVFGSVAQMEPVLFFKQKEFQHGLVGTQC